MTPNKAFKLVDKHDAYVVSLHIRNLMATYGEQEVREMFKVLFLVEQKKTKQRKGA
jgi:hypothetical protein